jgi:hypothetical protein
VLANDERTVVKGRGRSVEIAVTSKKRVKSVVEQCG